MDQQEAGRILKRILGNITQVVRGKEEVVRRMLAAFAGGGHVLLEDVPGTGKTTLAKALAKSISARFTRIQFTPDLLPSDILGVSVYNQKEQLFTFHEGPIFTQILLADEINRTSPRTQSALLEAMAEQQVSVEGKVRPLLSPFFVIATQNPVESHGAYPLPEAQMDRFAVRLSLGYVSPEEEVAILGAGGHSLEAIGAVASLSEVVALGRLVQEIPVVEELKHYVVALVGETRKSRGVQLGASPRASLALMKSAQALSLFSGEGFVTPAMIQEMAVPVIAHRLSLEPQARFSGLTQEQVVTDILGRLPVPV